LPDESRSPAPFAETDFLTLRVSGNAATPERLLLVGKPREGQVHVREWTSNSLNTAGEEYRTSAGGLLADIERAYAARRPVSEEMYRVRAWLAG
jgi:hypothetical protein